MESIKRRASLFAAFAALLLMTGILHDHSLCEGFVPANDERIPVELQVMYGGGVSEVEFHSALNRIEKHYAPIISGMGGHLRVLRSWDDATVNAYASRRGSVYQIRMLGGLARYSEMTADGFTLVACHEIGHHLAGAPKVRKQTMSWMSNEGQADYFAGLRCLRAIWPASENAAFVRGNIINSSLKATCNHVWQTANERNLCMRIGTAGTAVASLFQWLGRESKTPQFHTPDPTQRTQTLDSHPPSQCRLDTYFQAGLCVHDIREPLSNTDVRQGTCTQSAGYRFGNRPRCWYGERY